MQLQSQYAAFGRELDLQLEEKKLEKENQKINAIKNEIQEKGKSRALAESLAIAEAELAKVQAKLDGDKEEVPMAKFGSLEKFIDFMVNKYTGKVGTIESYLDLTATTTEQIKTTIINAITKTYIIDFPKNKSTKVYDEMIESDREKIKEKLLFVYQKKAKNF